jgi:hypothetical protein
VPGLADRGSSTREQNKMTPRMMLLASSTSDPELSGQMLEIVAIYERLADEAEKKNARFCRLGVFGP